MAASSGSTSADNVVADVRAESDSRSIQLTQAQPKHGVAAAGVNGSAVETNANTSSNGAPANDKNDDNRAEPLQPMDSFRARLKAARRETAPPEPQLQTQDSFKTRLKAARRDPAPADPLQPMDSFRARLKSARREAAPPASTLAQWETRGHFWEALDRAARPQDPTQGGLLHRWGQKLNVKTKNTVTVVRLRPSVLLWPLLLCGVCLTAGLVGVTLGSRHERDLRKDDAQAAASQTASALGMALEESLQPLRTLEGHVLLRPAMAALGPRFQSIAQQLVMEAPPVVASLLLAPFGVVRAVFTAPDAAGSGSGGLLGAAVVAPSALWTAASQLQSILLQAPPPAAAPSSPSAGRSPTLVAAHKPVLVPGAAANETWGNQDGDPGSGSGSLADLVPAVPAGSRLWGFASAVVDVGSTAGGQQAALDSLAQMGYLYRALLLSDDTGAVLAELDSSPPLPGGANPAVATAPARGVAATWQVEVEPEDGWTPSWQAAMTAVVVCVSVFLAAMLFAALVLRDRHVMLLEAMLPQKVIAVLGTGRNFFEHFDNVTVLYADIVRYSNAPAGMPAWEVVKLLNDVNNIYDALLDKHGLIKIRRSGEAFMGVGGCPTAEDPVATAVRVALCAREMVTATAAFRSEKGQRVQIRLGLHSGPAVAAVLGTEMPRFSLLGDVVDIAYFMESTSTIMGVHVSDTTAELLNIADDPMISLQPRGVIDMKGRGPITTFWLRIDLLAPMLSLTGGTFTDNGGSTVGLPRQGGGGGGGGGGAAATNGTAAGTAASGGGGAADRTDGAPAGRNAKAAPSDIACTADLAVAAQLGCTGAPLVRKLSQTGLTQTRRALPDRTGRRASQVYDNSLLGSFSMRVDVDTVALFGALMARSPGEVATILDLGGGGAGAGGGVGLSGEGTAVAVTGGGAATAALLPPPPVAAVAAVAAAELDGLSPKISTVGGSGGEDTAGSADGGAGGGDGDAGGGDGGEPRRRATTQLAAVCFDASDTPPVAVGGSEPETAAESAPPPVAPALMTVTTASAPAVNGTLGGGGGGGGGGAAGSGLESGRGGFLAPAGSSSLVAAAHLEIEAAES